MCYGIASFLSYIYFEGKFHAVRRKEDADGYDVVPQAWGPLAEGKDDIFNNPILSEIGSKYEKSVAQVILRWLIQRDIVVFPKSTKESRMLENADVFDFELTDEDMEKIKELETGVPIVEVDNPEFIKFVVSSIA